MSQPILIYLYTISSSFSFIGSVVIIYIYFKSRGSRITSQILLFRMGVCDAVYSISQFIMIYPDYIVTIRCKVQAFLEQSTSMGVFISCFLLSYFSYKSISSTIPDIQQTTERSLIYTAIFSIGLALIPMIRDETSANQFDCMFTGDLGDGDVELIFIFYLPLLFCLSASLIFDVKSLSYIKKLKLKSGERVAEIQAAQEILSNMFMYPIIFCLCWSGAIVYRISGLICTNCEDYINGGAILCLNNLQGFFNSIVYVYNFWKSKKIMGITIFPPSYSDKNSNSKSTVTEQFFIDASVSHSNEIQERTVCVTELQSSSCKQKQES